MSACVLLDEFGVGVQLLVATLAFLSLVIKRFHEFPRRPWKIWVFDSSKQALGAALSHLFNTSLGVVFGLVASSDACVWYLIHSVLDTSVGLALNVLFLKTLALVGSARFGSLDAGFYGHPPSVSVWLKQVLVWACVVCLSKLCVTLLVLADQVREPSVLLQVAHAVLSPVAAMPRVKLLVIMLLVPFVLNVVMFWIQDTFLKKSMEGATASWITYASLQCAAARDVPLGVLHDHAHRP